MACSRPLRLGMLRWKWVETVCRTMMSSGYHRHVSSCIMFPGQGSQYVGMCRELAERPGVLEMFYKANDCLGFDVMDVCLNGPLETLNKTLVCQPAVVLASLAAMQKLELEQGQDEGQLMMAGYSVGEITALIYSGALSLVDGLRLVGARAAAMDAASCKRSGGMVTVLGANFSQVEELCEATRSSVQSASGHPVVVSIACHLANHCFVVGGDKVCLDFVVEHAKDFGATSPVKPVRVSGAFHTVLMQDAQEELSAVLEKTSIQYPRCPVLSNVTAQPYASIEEIKKRLVEQLVMPVRWSDILMYMLEAGGHEAQWFEVGPGRQLARMLLWANRSAGKRCTNILA